MTNTVKIPIEKLHSFEGHPFKVLDTQVYGDGETDSAAASGTHRQDNGL